jgi:hypothetical protein
MERLTAESDAAERRKLAQTEALPLRIDLARKWETMMSCLLRTVDTPGGLGTVANLEQSTRAGLKFLDGHDADLEKHLGAPLPDDVLVSTRYSGEPRIIVPTARTVVSKGERLDLKVIVLDQQPPDEARLTWKPLGSADVSEYDLRHVARGVYQISLPEVPPDGAEYRIQIRTAGGAELVWPATAPEINHTLTQMP